MELFRSFKIHIHQSCVVLHTHWRGQRWLEWSTEAGPILSRCRRSLSRSNALPVFGETADLPNYHRALTKKPYGALIINSSG